MIAADYVLIPTESEYFSADGVSKIADTITQVRKLNKNLKVLGLLLVKHNGRRALTKAFQEVLDGAAKTVFDSTLFETTLRFTVDIPASQAMHQSVRDYKPSSKAAAEYVALAAEILRGIN